MKKKKSLKKLTSSKRLQQIAQIMEQVDNRCLACDGPVSKFQDEVTDRELRQIYVLATSDHMVD
jgi:hypothetical protein